MWFQFAVWRCGVHIQDCMLKCSCRTSGYWNAPAKQNIRPKRREESPLHSWTRCDCQVSVSRSKRWWSEGSRLWTPLGEIEIAVLFEMSRRCWGPFCLEQRKCKQEWRNLCHLWTSPPMSCPGRFGLLGQPPIRILWTSEWDRKPCQKMSVLQIRRTSLPPLLRLCYW